MAGFGQCAGKSLPSSSTAGVVALVILRFSVKHGLKTPILTDSRIPQNHR
jgi:hypothetical protein